jgi:hypothetical protein
MGEEGRDSPAIQVVSVTGVLDLNVGDNIACCAGAWTSTWCRRSTDGASGARATGARVCVCVRANQEGGAQEWAGAVGDDKTTLNSPGRRTERLKSPGCPLDGRTARQREACIGRGRTMQTEASQQTAHKDEGRMVQGNETEPTKRCKQLPATQVQRTF